MKKILAIAVATAIAAPAMADMTIGGSVTAIYGKDAAGTYGFGMDGASLTISGSETTESGLTFSGAMGLANLRRASAVTGSAAAGDDNPVEGGDASLSVSGDFGTFKVATIESGGDYTVGGGSADSLNTELGLGASDGANLDSVSYASPEVAGFTFAVGYSEAQNYNSSPVKPDYTVSTTVEGLALSLNYKPSEERTRLSAAYDFGVAALATKYEDNQSTSKSIFTVGATVPLTAAANLGVTYGTKEDATTSTDAWAAAVDYAVSANVKAVVSTKEDSTGTQSSSATVTLSF